MGSIDRSEHKGTNLRDELYDLDEDVEGRVPGNNPLGSLGEKTVDDALQSAGRRRVALAFYSHHVHPAQ